MKRAAHLFRVNPLIVKEIRSRMRGGRAFITLTIMLLVMGGVLYGTLQVILANSRYSTILSPQIGQAMFAALVFLELFMIAAITPAVTAGAISGEKEKQTYEMLMATPMSPSAILWGKLFSALSYVMLLLFAGIPLASLVFIFGGVAPGEMLKALLILVVVAVTFGILGLFMSALFGRSGRATVASFIVVVALTLGPWFVAIFIAAVRGGAEPPRWVLAPSPISAISAALASTMGQNSAGGLFWVLGGLFNMGVSPVSQTSIPRPLYHYSLPLYAVLSVVLFMLSTRLLQPTRRWRIPRRQLLVGLGILALLFGLIAGGFLATASRYEWNRVKVSDMSGMDIRPQVVSVPAVEAPQQVLLATATPFDPAAAPGSLLPTPTPASIVGEAKLEPETLSQVYALIARRLFTDGEALLDPAPAWNTIYLVGESGGALGDPSLPRSDGRLDQETRERITAFLGDLPANLVWVDSLDEVAVDPASGLLKDASAVRITFGSTFAQEGATLRVPVRVDFGALLSLTRTYMLSTVDGAWQINYATWQQE